MPDRHAFSDWQEYWNDAIQRGILFLDILRERGNINREHNAAVAPNVLHFDAEVVLDGLFVHGSVTLRGPIELTARHCTIWPGDGRPSFVVAASSETMIHLERCVTGPLVVSGDGRLQVRESIVDAAGRPAVVGSAGGPANWQIEVERSAGIARALERLICGVERLDHHW